MKLTDNQAEPRECVKDVTYNAAGQITAMKYVPNFDSYGAPGYYSEERSYNARQQLTRLAVSNAADLQYNYSDLQNNGRITSRKDWVSGEEVVYQYDSLQRLISAETAGPEWGQSFAYDGFGNLARADDVRDVLPRCHDGAGLRQPAVLGADDRGARLQGGVEDSLL